MNTAEDLIPTEVNITFVARLLKVRRATASAWVKDGKLKGERRGKQFIITKEELSRFITERHNK
jgi:excisionase family DNA binding protein